MIFIILGTQKFQFNRLLKKVDELIKLNLIKEEVYAQVGYSDYKPVYYSYTKFLDQKIFCEYIDNSSLIITHGGTGAIISALKRNKKIVAIPRLSRYQEHVDDHQVEIINEFYALNYLEKVDNMEELHSKLVLTKNKEFSAYQSNTNNILDMINLYIDKTFLEKRRVD